MTSGGGVRPPGAFDGAPVVKGLFVINVAVFLLTFLSADDFRESKMYDIGQFTIAEAWMKGQVWRVFSFQFLHGGIGHLAFNMIGLYFFGRHVEQWMGSRPFLIYYLACGVAGVVFYTFLFFVPGLFEGYDVNTPMVGASAGLLGLLAVFMVRAPDATVLLFFFIPMKVRTFSILFFTYETMAVLFNFHNAGGSAGHLGGALFGLAVMTNEGAQNWLRGLGKPKRRGGRTVREAKVVRESRSPYQMSREIDRILDKISEEGFESLTQEERKTLDDARK